MDRIVTAHRREGSFTVRTRSGARLLVAPGPGSDGPGPMELMLVSLATCAGDTLGLVLERMRRPAADLAVTVAGERAERPPRVWNRVEVVFLVRGEIPPDRLAHAVEVTERTCGASVMLARATDLGVGWIAVRRVAPELTRPLRQRILRPHQDLDELVVPGEDAPGGAWFGAVREDGQVVGSAGVFPEPSPDHPGREDCWRLRAMAVEESLRGSGVGRMLLDACLDHVRAQGGRMVWCAARVPARGFYERAGFTPTSEVYPTPDIGPHLRMARHLE